MDDQERGGASGGYASDPGAEVAVLVDAFFAALDERFPDERGLAERLRRRQERLVAEQQERLLDEPSRHNLTKTLAVFAAYQELRSRHDDIELIRALRAAFVELLEPYVQTATRDLLDGARDPFAAMVQPTKDKEQHAFGAGFEFTHPDEDQDRYTARVERCYYHEVLNANGAGKLTRIFCSFDANWIDAINPDLDGFQFERPTTIGAGGPNCPFRFRRSIRTADA
jgi:hypothetical protein